jgi:hypothetical protein
MSIKKLLGRASKYSRRGRGAVKEPGVPKGQVEPQEEGPKRADYMTVGLPKKLADEVERLIKSHPELGFRSKTEFAIQAVRAHIADTKRDLFYSGQVEDRDSDAGPITALEDKGVEPKRGRGFSHRLRE